MKFTELDQRMRQFETAHDHCVLPGIHIVIRLDGRNFTSLTKSSDTFEPPLSAPFDERFRGAMLVAAERCMTSGFAVVFGYTQSDEISLLLARDESSFGRKERKLCSVLAGEASAAFSLATGIHGCFDGRVCQLPQDSDVVDYFRWRAEDAHRNALSAHCYWLRRRSGEDSRAADAWLRGMSTADKNEFLFQNGINYNDLPAWQKRGGGLRWERVQKAGVDPRTGEATSTERRQLRRELELPVGEAFAALISGLIAP